MKRSILFVTLMMVSAWAYSQSTLKGPKAKNATAIERAANSSPIQVRIEPIELKGPIAKNEKVWEQEGIRTQTVFVRKEEPLKGPKAKNRKVWKD